MNKNILIGILSLITIILLSFILLDSSTDHPLRNYTELESKEVAESWIVSHASTFTERGGQDLIYIGSREVEESVFEVVFDFQTRYSGYGEVAEDETPNQVITPRTILLEVDSNEVVTAITDDAFDEINNESVAVVDFSFIVTRSDGRKEITTHPREIDLVNGIEKSALIYLLERVAVEEREAAFSCPIPEGVELLSFDLDAGVATVDLSSEMKSAEPNNIMSAEEQIEMTLTQFDSVEEVVIMVEGEEISTEDEEDDAATVDLYFIRVVDSMEEIVPISREIDLVNGVEQSTLVALLDGVTEDEEAEGYSSSIPEEAEFLDFNLEDGVVTVDFTSDIEPGGGSAWVMSIRDQIEMTLTQFDSVEEVVIMVEGEEEEVLQP